MFVAVNLVCDVKKLATIFILEIISILISWFCFLSRNSESHELYLQQNARTFLCEATDVVFKCCVLLNDALRRLVAKDTIC